MKVDSWSSKSVSSFSDEFKRSSRLAVPLIFSEVIYALSGFLATVMIAHLDKNHLAANALVWSVYNAVILLFIGILCAVGILVAQSYGAKDHSGVASSFKQGIILSGFFAIFMAIIICLMPEVLRLFDQDPVVIAYAEPFFYSLGWVMLPLNFFVVAQQFLVAVNRPRIVVVLSTLCVPIEVFFCYVLLFGKWGFPKLGLAGIGYGLTASFSVCTILFIWYAMVDQSLSKYQLFKGWWKIEIKFFTEIVRVGFPQGVMWSSELVFFVVVAVMMGKLGVDTLAAFQIANQYLTVAMVIVFAIGQTVSVRASNEVGCNNRSGIKLVLIANLVLALSILSIFCLVYTLFPGQVISLDVNLDDLNYQRVVSEALKYFPVVGVCLLIDCLRVSVNGALRALKDTKYQLAISMIGFWVISFPVIYFLGFKFSWGGVGVWWGVVIGLLATGLMLGYRFIKLVERIELSGLVTRK